jgi:hypothetical protein
MVLVFWIDIANVQALAILGESILIIKMKLSLRKRLMAGAY